MKIIRVLMVAIGLVGLVLPLEQGNARYVEPATILPEALNTAGDTYELQVTPSGNPNNVTAVALNVTVVDGEAASVGGYVTVFPCGERPDASNLNFVNGQTVPNAVVAPVSADGRVCFYVFGRAHLLVDVAGYFTSGFTALSRPERMLNTRTTGVKVGALDGSGEPASLTVVGQQGIPSGVSAVALNVTVVDGEAASVGGYVTVFPCGERPDASNLNFVNGQTVPNAVVAPVSADGRVCFYVFGRAHLLVDVAGYFTSGFTALSRPERMLNTRTTGVKVGALDGSGEPASLTVVGQQGIPSGVSAVALNVTVVDGEAASVGGYVTVFPCGERPDASNLNFVNGQTVPNAVVAPVSADGRVCFYVFGRAHLLVDVAGYFTSGFTALSRPERMLNTRTTGVKVGINFSDSQTGGATKLPSGPLSLGLDFSGAEAVIRTQLPVWTQEEDAQASSVGSLSNLFKVDSAGQVTSVTTTTSFTAGEIEVSPTGKVYAVSSSGPCRLSETDPSNNLTICVEATDELIGTGGQSSVQFDSSGAVYYQVVAKLGRVIGGSPFRCPAVESSLRRYSNGIITEMFRLDGQMIGSWKATPNGSIIFSGQRFATEGECSELDHATKLINRDRELSTVTQSQTRFFSDFGTEFVFFGFCSEEECGQRRFNPLTDSVDSTWHLAGDWNGGNSRVPRVNDSGQICRNYSEIVTGEFCGNLGTFPGPFVSTASGKHFAVVRSQSSPWYVPQAVFQYYPTVQPVIGSLVRSRTIETIGDYLFLAGRDSAGSFATVRIDTNTGQETTVIPASVGYDVVQLEGDAENGRLYFRGTQVSGGADVFGYVTLASGAITIKQVAGATVADVDPLVTN